MSACSLESLQRRVQVARGDTPGDLLLRGGRVVNVFSGSVDSADVVIADGVIAGAGPYAWSARETVDLDGRVITPGLIDAHMHIESTLLTPAEFARVVVPRGTTAVVADPHEIGNVLGEAGIAAMIAASEGLPLDCFFTAPSCVPASPFEASAFTLDAAAIERLLQHERVIGLAEMMNFPGVLASDPDVLAKVRAAAAEGRAVDGHCPGLLGRDLVAYAAAGIEADHECTTIEEALERDALGMLVQVREGSMARNLDTMLPAIADGRLRNWCLCTDDILPEDLLRDGHLDGLLRRVVAAGVSAATAVRHASWIPAQHYGRAHAPLRKCGAVAPGYTANIAVFDDLETFTCSLVIKGGAVVARDGAYRFDGVSLPVPTDNTIHLGPIDDDAFDFAPGDGETDVIGVIPDQIVTRHERRTVSTSNGRFAWTADDDVALIACIHRHEPTGRTGVGLVSGFSLTKPGAIGTSIGHDSHNLVIAGTHPREMLACARALRDLGGGCACVADGNVVATMRLPVAGLLSTEPAEDVCAQQKIVNEAARGIGCRLASPYGTLSFLPLSVIPSLKITDRGLFDVEQFALID